MHINMKISNNATIAGFQRLCCKNLTVIIY